MKAIQDVVQLNKGTNQVIQQTIEKIKQSAILQPFILKHEMTDDELVANAITLLKYEEYVEHLQRGVLISGNSHLEGYLLMEPYRRVEFGYRYNEQYDQLQKIREYVECWHMDEHMLTADMQDFVAEQQSPAAMKAMIMVQREITKGQIPSKGLFISGENGVGKTHMLAALAKAFYAQKIKTIIVFFPELIRELKQNPYTADKIIRQLQRVPVLMIDDIGSEMQTSFSRDEILLPILNARMNNKRLTFFTSNLDLQSLEHHFTHTQYGENEPIKAKRMMERIHALTEYAPLFGENKRRR